VVYPGGLNGLKNSGTSAAPDREAGELSLLVLCRSVRGNRACYAQTGPFEGANVWRVLQLNCRASQQGLKRRLSDCRSIPLAKRLRTGEREYLSWVVDQRSGYIRD